MSNPKKIISRQIILSHHFLTCGVLNFHSNWLMVELCKKTKGSNSFFSETPCRLVVIPDGRLVGGLYVWTTDTGSSVSSQCSTLTNKAVSSPVRLDMPFLH